MSSSVVEKFESMEYGPAPEDAGEVYRWLEAHKRMFGHYIGGAFTPVGSYSKGASFEAFTVKNPATGEVLATVKNAVILAGHTDSQILKRGSYSNWELSTDRANGVRRRLEGDGLAPSRVLRVEGLAATDPLLPLTPPGPFCDGPSIWRSHVFSAN